MSESNRYKKYEPLFGKWYITGEIGQGAVGHVYEIERNELDTVYKAALKAITIPENPDDIKKILSRGVAREDLPDYYRNLAHNIAREFQYLARLKGNSYIVNYEDHEIKENADELKWDIMIKTELLTPLIEHAIEHPLSERDVIRLGIDVCRALKYCAHYNIIHRDIKPENIFISPGGDFKLGDFGIARVVEETQMDLSRKGTYTYMAPEVFHGQAYGKTVDIYSLGIVMYQYLNNGRIPFMAPYPKKLTFDDSEKAFAERMSGKIVPKPERGTSKLKKIILKACSYNAEDRYASADEMLDELEELWLSVNRKKPYTRKRFRNASVSGRAVPEEGVTISVKEDRTANNITEAAAEAVVLDETTSKEVISDDAVTKEDLGQASTQNTAVENNRSGSQKRRLLCAVCLILLLAAGTAYAMIPKEVTDITGIDAEVSMYYDGELSPEYKVEPDWFKDEKIRFASGNSDVFTVSKDGVLKAVTIGEADLNMEAKDYSETVHVSVVPKVTSIAGIEEAYSLYPGNEIRLEPALAPEEFVNEEISYASSDEAVATVSGDGLITAAGVGKSVITISAGGTSITTTVNVLEPVVVRPATSSKRSGKSSGSTSKKKPKSSSESFGDDEYF